MARGRRMEPAFAQAAPHGAGKGRTGRLMSAGYSCRSLVKLVDGAALPQPVSVLRAHLPATGGAFARLSVTDQGRTGLQDPTGWVYRLRPSGEPTCLVDTVPSPNGIVILPAPREPRRPGRRHPVHHRIPDRQPPDGADAGPWPDPLLAPPNGPDAWLSR